MKGDVLAVDADELGAPQRPGIADQQQGAVAQAREAAVTAADQPADLRRGQRRGLARR